MTDSFFSLWSGALGSFLVIGAGAAIGAWLRWLLGLWLNALWPSIPPGTLLANLLGGYLIGLAFALFARHPQLALQWKLFLVTGLLGGLTTFSTFSVEVLALLQASRFGAAAAAVALHVVGSVAMTLLGWATYAAWVRA